MGIFEELASTAGVDFAQARMLPVEAYRSPEVLALETERLFGTDWLCVGRTADLPESGDYLTAELPTVTGSRSVIVLRSGDDVQAFDNVCIHRGARLLDGCGHTERITCPYHAWVYRTDGSLIGGPYMNDSVEADGSPFDPAQHQLNTVATEVWEGFIFVNQRSTGEPLAAAVAGLTEVVSRYQMADYVPVFEQVDVWDTNWKLLVENFMDALHIFKVHSDSFAADGDNTLDTTMYPGTSRWAHHRVHHDGGPDLADPANTHLTDDWRKTIVLGAVFPGFVIQLQPDWLWFLRITPVGTGQVRVAWQVAIAPDTLASQTNADAYVGQVMELIHQVNSEDKPIVEGLRANVERPQFDRAPLSYLERNVYDFDQYIATRLTN